MIFLISLVILLSSSSISQEIEEIVQFSRKQQIDLVDDSKEELESLAQFQKGDAKKQEKCLTETLADEEFSLKNQNEDLVEIYISSSVPIETLKEYSIFLEKCGGRFVLNGLFNNSFQEFSKRIMDLRREGVNAKIEIDPDAFIFNQISVVPTIVLRSKQGSDKIEGNIKVESALRLFAEKGNGKERVL